MSCDRDHPPTEGLLMTANDEKEGMPELHDGKGSIANEDRILQNTTLFLKIYNSTLDFQFKKVKIKDTNITVRNTS